MMQTDQKTALIAGATGLVGGELLKRLLADKQYTKITVLTRRKINVSDKKIHQLLVDFDALESHRRELFADRVFCCLGTTQEKAGSKRAFRQVDHDYPLKLAQLTHQQGSACFVLVSAIGADVDSSIFYNQVKGQTEQAIERIGFAAYHVIRPSLLLGDRQESRPLEDIMGKLSKVTNVLLFGPMKKYRAIEARQVAKAMQIIAASKATGKIIHLNDELAKY